MPDSPPERLRSLRFEADADIAALVSDWADGRATWEAVSADITDLLEAGHADSHALGRQHAGEPGGVTDEDRSVAADVWDGEMVYWNGVDADVRAGRYGEPGNAKADALTRRVSLYPRKWRATADRAWVDTQDDGVLFTWELDDGAMNCSQCPDHAAGSPYTWETLPGFPGDGETCDSICNCLCHLISDDGIVGFSW